MKVALVFAPIWNNVMPPIALAYIKGNVARHQVRAFDFNQDFVAWWREKEGDNTIATDYMETLFYMPNSMSGPIENDQKYRLAQDQWRETYSELLERWLLLLADYDALGVSVSHWNFMVSDLIGSEFQKRYPDRPVIFGGVGCTLDNNRGAKYLLARGAAAAIHGPGEFVLDDLLDVLAKGESPAGIPGVICRENETFIATPPADFPIADLAAPVFDDFTLSGYDHQNLLPFYSAVGCVGRCTFCRVRQLAPGCRARPVERFIAELQELRQHYQTNTFFASQPLFNVGPLHFKQTLQALVTNGFRISYQLRIMPYLDDPEIMELAKACSEWIIVGLESASPSVRKHMGKYADQEKTMRIVRLMAKYQLPTSYNLIIGYPTETEEDFAMTLEFIKEAVTWEGRVGLTVNTFFISPGFSLEEHDIKLDRDYHWYNDIVDVHTRYQRYCRVKEFLDTVPEEKDAPKRVFFHDQNYQPKQDNGGNMVGDYHLWHRVRRLISRGCHLVSGKKGK